MAPRMESIRDELLKPLDALMASDADDHTSNKDSKQFRRECEGEERRNES